MGRSFGSSPSLFSSLLHFVLSLAPLFFLSSSEQTPFKEVSLENPVAEFVPSLHSGFSCERIRVIGTSRVNLKLYASSVHVALKASGGIPERLQGKIEVCHHRNVSLGICQCENDDWKTLQKGQWSAVISPYEKRYIDIKSKEKLPGSVTVIVEEEFQQWRLICLGSGFLLLILAPIISTWVPFYVCSSMAVGVLGVVLLLAFQLMKLLPMGRKNMLYITLYGSVLGVGSYIVQYFSTVVNSILVNFGLSEEMHYPVSVMLLVLIVLAGAALGYWIVRKYVISEDGSVDAGIAHFVKWAMRVLGIVSVLQSSLDSLLPVIALGIYGFICFLLKKWQSRARFQLEHSGNELWQPRRGQAPNLRQPRAGQAPNLRQPRAGQASNLWQPRAGQASASSSKRTEFLTRSPNNDIWSAERSSSSPYGQSNLHLTAGHTYSSPRQRRSAIQQGDYYSSFHRTPLSKFSRREWEDFTQESTREALAEWASSPEFTRWMADNAHRVRVDPEHNSDDSEESSSNSSDETMVEDSNNRFGLFNWY